MSRYKWISYPIEVLKWFQGTAQWGSFLVTIWMLLVPVTSHMHPFKTSQKLFFWLHSGYFFSTILGGPWDIPNLPDGRSLACPLDVSALSGRPFITWVLARHVRAHTIAVSPHFLTRMDTKFAYWEARLVGKHALVLILCPTNKIWIMRLPASKWLVLHLGNVESLLQEDCSCLACLKMFTTSATSVPYNCHGVLSNR